MTLRDREYQPSYNKAKDDIAEEFYLPCMRSAKRYDRVSGYFSSTIYIIAWGALKDFIANQGKMRIVCAPFITDSDREALSKGYSARSNEIVANAIKREVQDIFKNEYLSAPSRLLAYLVAEGIVDVKIAVPNGEESADARRMFHDKVGIFSDDSGNIVGFRGSMNETFKGLSSDGNIESIDVFPNWLDDRDKTRAEEAKTFFEKLWTKVIPGIDIYQFPQAARKILEQKSDGVNWERLLEEINVSMNIANKWKPNYRRDTRTPLKHQAEALESWEANGRRGIFEHATGSGKTFTAICAVHDALKKGETVIIVVPSRELLNQWHKEIEETLEEDDISYLLCGDGNSRWKKGNTLRTWTSKEDNLKRVIIATMDTASSDAFIQRAACGNHLFLVADEVHRLGSVHRRNVLRIETGPRLGLSATPYRYGDPEGTEKLFNYFGDIIQPPFTLKDAIANGVLTPYFYYPKQVQLSIEEQENWDEITREIQKIAARINAQESSQASFANDKTLKQMQIKRARIVKNAQKKTALALSILKNEYRPGQKWIIYCDNEKQLKSVLNGVQDLSLDGFEYYANMKGDRDTTLEYFASNGGILVSIKCLDEGVDIPSATHALILASSHNPREFIQRRGRILRKFPGKHFAHLYDAITIPFTKSMGISKVPSIIEGELSRAIQFGEWAENPSCVTELKNIAIEHNIDFDTLYKGGFEDDEK